MDKQEEEHLVDILADRLEEDQKLHILEGRQEVDQLEVGQRNHDALQSLLLQQHLMEGRGQDLERSDHV